MAIDFPSSPANNQTYTVGLKTWVYNGTSWDVRNATLSYNDIVSSLGYVPLNVTGGTVSGNLNITTGTIIANGSPGSNGFVLTSTGAAMYWSNSIGSTQIVSLGVGTPASGVSGEIRATNNITAYYSSDKRLKENVRRVDNALDKVDSINGVYFDWTDEYIKNNGGEDGYFVRKNDVGVIAQEIEEILPEAVATREDGFKAVRYEKIIAVLIEAIKELKQEVRDLKNQNK